MSWRRGVTHTVRAFVQAVAEALSIELRWSGEGLEEKAIDAATGKTAVAVSATFFRPSEVDALTGDAGQIARDLGWRPATGFAELVEMMARADFDRLRRGAPLL